MGAERADEARLDLGEAGPVPFRPAEEEVGIELTRRRERRARRVETLEERSGVLVDRVVLTHGMNVTQAGVGRDPGRVVMRDPEGDRRVIAEQLHHLRHLLAN